MQYTYGLGTDQLVAVKTAAAADSQYYAVTDPLGTVRGLVRRDGTWWESQRFDPYGNLVKRDTTTAGAQVPLRYAWTGREYDAETGWYFHRARYYDPGAKRFVQEDPIGYEGGPNLYGYVGGAGPPGTRSVRRGLYLVRQWLLSNDVIDREHQRQGYLLFAGYPVRPAGRYYALR